MIIRKTGIFLFIAMLALPLAGRAQTRVIELDATAVDGALAPALNMSIGAGRANEGLRADWQQQLAQIKRDAGFRYIRMHGLLSDDMAVYRVDAQGKEQYNFQYIDALYDYLLSIGVKPFVELGFMPSHMASGEKTIFWWRANVTPPKDYAAWERLTWIPEMIAYCTRNGVPLDFVSTHTYGVDQGFLDEYGSTGTVLSKDDAAISGDVIRNRKQIAASAMPALELHCTEWSSSYTPADPSHDSYHQAAYILQKLKQVGAAAQSMSYCVFTDIFEEAGPRMEAFKRCLPA